MLPAKYRLQLRRTLPFYLFEQKCFTPLFHVYWRKTSEALPAQVACVVPKKVARTAVLRNRTKRVLSASLFEMMASLPSGLQCVIVARRADLADHPDVLCQKLHELFVPVVPKDA